MSVVKLPVLDPISSASDDEKYIISQADEDERLDISAPHTLLGVIFLSLMQ